MARRDLEGLNADEVRAIGYEMMQEQLAARERARRDAEIPEWERRLPLAGRLRAQRERRRRRAE